MRVGAQLALFGATGFTGRLLVAAAAERGHEIVLVGRDRDALGEIAAGQDAVQDVRVCDVTDPSAVRGALGGTGVIVAALSGAATDGVRRAAVGQGRPLVDTDADVLRFRTGRRALDADARAAGIPAVWGAGWRTAVGELLMAVAAPRLAAPREVHVAYTVPDRGGVVAASSSGERAAFADALRRPITAWADGGPVTDVLGERRRLAWFPRPLGPHHAASVPGLEALWAPSSLPDLDTVRTYLAVSSLRAELLQAAGNLSRWEPGRRRLSAWLTRGAPGGGPPPAARASTRWACVAEVGGDGPTVRGWANGHDPHGVTATIAVVLAEALATSPPATGGVLAPSAVASPGEVLDALAAAGALRWSVAVPAQPRH